MTAVAVPLFDALDLNSTHKCGCDVFWQVAAYVAGRKFSCEVQAEVYIICVLPPLHGCAVRGEFSKPASCKNVKLPRMHLVGRHQAMLLLYHLHVANSQCVGL